MSDPIYHECGVAAIRLRKPLAYFAEKYGSPAWALQKLFLLMEKQHNRGQDGAGIGCVKLGMPLGEPYIFRARDASPDALTRLFEGQQRVLHRLRKSGELAECDAAGFKRLFPFGGEILMGHLRYGTSGAFDEGSCHPFLRRTDWPARTLMVLGNFNLTNAPELSRRLIGRGQHPLFGTDTLTVLEELGYELDEAHTDLYRELRGSLSGQALSQEVARRLDLADVLRKAAAPWDGGFCIMGALGSGDFFCLRDPHGIRPCHYLLTDEYLAVASEQVPLMSVLGATQEQVHQLPRAHALVMKADGALSVAPYTEPLEPTPCSFEAIYFSRGNDPTIYRQRKALGAALAERLVGRLAGNFSHAAISFIPNTAEIAYDGLLEGLRRYRRHAVAAAMKRALAEGRMSDALIEELILRRWPRAEKIVHKDIKLRTFIAQEGTRGQLASQVYDLTPGAVGQGEVLVAIDDSIVRGTTLKNSLLRLLGRAHPARIIILSSAPQIRYPDCYGIDMSEMGKFIAFQAAIGLLRARGMQAHIDAVYAECRSQLALPPHERRNPVKRIYVPFSADELTAEIARLVTPEDAPCPVELIFQTLEGLHRAIPGPCGDWYFSGDYPTPGGYTAVNRAFANWYEGKAGRAYEGN